MASNQSEDDTTSSSLSVIHNAALPIASMGTGPPSQRGSAHLHPNRNNDDTTALDFIGTSNAVKKLFTMSLDTSARQTSEKSQAPENKPMLLAVHNFNGTLIIDDAVDESSYESSNRFPYYPVDTDEGQLDGEDRSQAASASLLPPSSHSLALALSNDSSRQQSALSMLSDIVHPATQVSSSSKVVSSEDPRQGARDSNVLAPPREYLPWKFQDLNLLLGHDTLVVRTPSSETQGGGIAVRVEDVEFLRTVWDAFQRQQQQQQPLLGSNDSTANRLSYAQALLRERKGNEDETSDTKIETVETEESSKAEAFRDSVDQVSKTEEENQSVDQFSEVPLQTCIVPFSGPLGGHISRPISSSESTETSTASPSLHSGDAIGANEHGSSPALSIVLDAYLDNLMTNVPQLALCLQEKGVIQSVKLLSTDDIPSRMLHSSTLDTSRPVEVFPTSSRNGKNSSQQRLEENIFSPQIMEMNASALLRFLKTHCTENHATYLLRHEGTIEEGQSTQRQQNIQLYDISSISTQKQKKWIWWLATMSYRFALRLRQLETSTGSTNTLDGLSESQKRSIRDRQRSLFQQTLDLLQDLMDIDGNAHESMVASVREHMADTYLSNSSIAYENIAVTSPSKERSATRGSFSSKFPTGATTDFKPSPSPPVVAMAASSKVSFSGTLVPSSSSTSPTKINHIVPAAHQEYNPYSIPSSDTNTAQNHDRYHQQPYATVSIDKLNKAQDHLVRGIKSLSSLLDRDLEERRTRREKKQRDQEMSLKKSRRRKRHSHAVNNELEEKSSDDHIPALSPAMVMQLFGMNFKLINISLRLAEHHLRNYYSSSAMQALRTAARRLKDAAYLLDYYTINLRATNTNDTNNQEQEEQRQESLQLQYIWLLEHCGHFARSFASDGLWRDRGHASGEDIISVLLDVESVFVDNDESKSPYLSENDSGRDYESQFWKMVSQRDVLLKESRGHISLQSLSGILSQSGMDIKEAEEHMHAAKAVLNKEKILVRERRKVLIASCVSYSRAITAFQYTVVRNNTNEPTNEKRVLLNLLRQRLGDACNETGKMLLATLRTILVNNQGGKKNDGTQVAAEVLLDSAEFWFNQGLDAFGACRDTRNLALLRCNLCQSYKLRANSGFSKGDTSGSSKHAEDCLQEAANQLLAAHEDLGERDFDPQTWDMVSEELAATFLVLGVRRRQSLLGSGNAPVIFQVMRLTPGEERSIVDPMERALKIYQQSDNAHQAAALHYQLALTFSKLWTCQLNETNTRRKLSKAFEHYSSAFQYFSNHSRGNEPTFCLLCLDLASLYSAIPGEEGLIKSLGCCLDCCDAFSIDAIKASTAPATSNTKSTTDWYTKMETIAQSVDDRVFKLLRSLVKIDPDSFKEMYREGLTAKMVRNVREDDKMDFDPKYSSLLSLHEVLLAIKEKYGTTIASK